MSAQSSKTLLIHKDTNIEQKNQLECQMKIIRVLRDKYTNKENPSDTIRKYSVKANASKIMKAKLKKVVSHKDDGTQTSPRGRNKEDDKDNRNQQNEITAKDLTDEKPSEYYWERLAEKRRAALEETLQENEHLRQRIDGLEKELKLWKKQCQEVQQLVGIINEVINEEDSKDVVQDEVNSSEKDDDCDRNDETDQDAS